MLRHLKNANELVFYASISCGAAFVSRILPAFYFPILLLRLGVFIYCFWVLFKAEGQKELAILIGSSLFIGMIGGYFDLFEIWLRYDMDLIIRTITTVVTFLLIVSFIAYQVLNNGKSSK